MSEHRSIADGRSGQYVSDGIVTPEAVVIDLPLAGLGSRIGAALIDTALRYVMLIALIVAVAVFGTVARGGPSWVGLTIGLLGTFLITVGYSVIFEAAWSGRTPGKAALGLRVVTVSGAPIRFRHAAIRGALGLVEIAMTFGGIAALVMLLNKKHQRIGDVIAGTVVLRERVASKAPRIVMFQPPPDHEDYARQLDVSAITNDQFMAVRTLLLRVHSLEPSVRQQLCENFARSLVGQVAVLPPAWMSAEGFLFCVAAAYQRRFEGR